LEKFEEMVGLVDFGSSFCQEDYIANQASHFQEHFLSQIVLRKLAVNFHAALQAGEFLEFFGEFFGSSFFLVITSSPGLAGSEWLLFHRFPYSSFLQQVPCTNATFENGFGMWGKKFLR
jgi:hypothetical protein